MLRDSSRQRFLAEMYLDSLPEKFPSDRRVAKLPQNLGRIDLLASIAEELDKQHQLEREVSSLTSMVYS